MVCNKGGWTENGCRTHRWMLFAVMGELGDRTAIGRIIPRRIADFPGSVSRRFGLLCGCGIGLGNARRLERMVFVLFEMTYGHEISLFDLVELKNLGTVAGPLVAHHKFPPD
jgi:hypothetical protein